MHRHKSSLTKSLDQKSFEPSSVAGLSIGFKKLATRRLTFLILSIFLGLPIIYLHIQLIHTTPHNETHHQPVHQKLQDFQAEKNRRKQHLFRAHNLTRPHNTHQKHLPHLSNINPSTASDGKRILTLYLEDPANLHSTSQGLQRNSSRQALTKLEFPQHPSVCSTKDSVLPSLPIDDFPSQDPFLPWIHDYFVSEDASFVRFVAQNRRRCDTGKDHIDTMAFWEPQIALFQAIPVVEENNASETTFRLASSFEEATNPATRFQCHFQHPLTNMSRTTLSVFKFDYELVTWKKLRRPMLDRGGSKDSALFWLSTLLFACPIPKDFQSMLTATLDERTDSALTSPPLYLDLVPIRTPARTKYLLTTNQTGPEGYRKLDKYSLRENFGRGHSLPPIEDAGRWANLPICPRSDENKKADEVPTKEQVADIEEERKRFQMVACTWTASSYTRRGDVVRVSDSARRLREWIVFHLMVGVDHVYVYDNTDPKSNNTEVIDVVREFSTSNVTYHSWPCRICNNNRPANANPGERSSQYAAEASCRERYGLSTEWMTFLDVDEYLVPLQKSEAGDYNWKPILQDIKSRNVSILQFLSSRAKPRVGLMEEVEDQSTCIDPTGDKEKMKKFPNTDACIEPRTNETYLHTYNCEYIRPPKPQRFERARKQIYRPAYVWSHYVHYSTVTADYAETYDHFTQYHNSKDKFLSSARGPNWKRLHPEVFADELNQGGLIHARSVMPHETRRRSSECYLNSKASCLTGHLCEDSVEFVDATHQDNVFQNPDGSYCNCWRNGVVEDYLVPQLQRQLDKHTGSLQKSIK